MTATPIIAAFPKYPGFMENVWFITTGFLLVVGILALLALFTSLVGQRFKAAAAKAARPAPAAAKAPPADDDPNIPYVLAAATKAMTEDLATDKHLPFLLAAAVDEALQGRPHRIVNVRAFGESWAREGRRDIFGSHRVR